VTEEKELRDRLIKAGVQPGDAGPMTAVLWEALQPTRQIRERLVALEAKLHAQEQDRDHTRNVLWGLAPLWGGLLGSFAILGLLWLLSGFGGGSGYDPEREHRLDTVAIKVAVESIEREVQRLHGRLDGMAARP
jgi:hypothetical protein